MGSTPVQLAVATDSLLQVVPAPLMQEGPVLVQPAAVTSAGGLQQEIFGFAPYWQLANSGNWNYGLLSTVAYFGLDVNGDGSINTSTAGWTGWNSQELVNMINRAHQAGDRAVVVIKAFDNATINAIVTSSAATQTAITNTINAIASKSLDGVNVDFEGSSSPSFPNIQSGFTNFMTQLSRQVHQRWPDAMVSADTYSGSASWDGGIFNIGALAPAVDALFVMAYDMVFSNLPGQAGPNAPLNGWTYNDNIVVAQYLSKAPASKVILGVPYYGYKWSTTSNQPYAATRGGASADTYSGILDDFSCARATLSWDATGESPWASWFSPASGDPCGGNFNSWRELYYDNATSLGRKYDLVNAKGLRGTGMWALGYDGASPDLWQALAAKFSWTASYDVSGVPASWVANQTQTFPVTVTNTAGQTWPAGGPNPVHLGMHFTSAAGQFNWFTDQRFNLSADVPPGGRTTLTVTVTAPATTQAVVLEARMVKEWQFWFGQWAPVAVTMAAPVWKAGYDVSGVPRGWITNQAQSFPVTVTNMGNQVWPAGGSNPVHLGMHFTNAAGQFNWFTDQRFSLPADLAPSANITFTVTATAPTTTDASVLEARMVKEWQFWFDQSVPVSIGTAPPTWAAAYDASAVPRIWATNQTQTFPLKVTNTGNQTWPAGGANPVHLGVHFTNAAGRFNWFTDQRVNLPADLAPGGSVTLMVSATAPGTTAAVVLEARMVKEWQFWFDEWTPVSIGTGAPIWAAGYDLSSAPRSWAANQTQTFPVTVTNTGNQVWPAGGPNPVHLGVHFTNTAGQFNWFTDQRVSLPADLPPGASVTLTVTATAPATTDAGVLETRMVKEWQFWFGQFVPVSLGTVPALWAAGYDASLVPHLWATNQTQTFPLTVTNTGNQTWPAGGPNPVHLGVHFTNAAGQFNWFTDQRVNLPADLAPGSSVTLSVSATAPATTEAAVLEARMVKEWQFWFDESTPVSVGTAAPAWTAGYDLSSVPRSWAPNQTQTFPITVTNAGNQVWPAGGPNPVHLGMHFSSAAGQFNWLSDQRINLPADLTPGAAVTLNVSATAPASAGAVILEARMVKEWQFWFDQWDPVTVTNLAP